MQAEKLSRDVQKELAKLTNTDPADWFLVFRARYGIETVLQTLGEHRGTGEVITQPFTCTTAVNPILSAGHIPVYIDTSCDDLSLDTSKLEASAASRALIMQHSFGIACNMKEARAFAHKHRLLLLEDAAHSLGLLSRDADGKPLADVSVHSFGVEKMLATKFGGAVWVNPQMQDSTLRKAIVQALKNLPVVDRKIAGQARRYRFFNRVLNHLPAIFVAPVKNVLFASGLFTAAIMPDELRGHNHDKPMRPNARMITEMLTGLKTYEPLLAKRRTAVNTYLADLPEHLTVPKQLLEEPRALVRFPVLCENKPEAERLFSLLRREGYYSGKWYNTTLFPGVARPETYNYDPELCPVAESIAHRILNLPTNISAEQAKEILDVLHRETNRQPETV